MDDTKKLIEKYKRELMELSKQKKPPKVIGYVDGDNTILSEIRADLSGGSKPEKTESSADLKPDLGGSGSKDPREDPDSGLGRSAPKNTGNSADFDSVFGEPGSESLRESSGMDLDESYSVKSENSGKNQRKNSGDPKRDPGENISQNRANSSGRITEIIDEYQPGSPENNGGNSEKNPKCCSGDPEKPGNPDVIFERTNSSGSITEIIGEYQPEAPGNNGGNPGKIPKCNSEDPENFGDPDVIFERTNSADPEQDSRENNSKSPRKNSGNSGGGVQNYTKIPSTESVRQGITDNSSSENNVVEQNVSGITRNTVTAPANDSAAAIRTTEEQAERLNDQPVSGQDPNEQLTGRSFEGRDPLPETDISMEQGSRAEPIDYPEKNFSNFEEFEKVNTGKGSLIFRVYTGREAVVIEGAECVITKKIGNEVRTIAELTTNESGQTPVQELPAPPKELSQHSENTIQPFSLYDATVTKPGFIRVVLKDIPIFDGVQSVQRVFMIVE